MNKLDNTNDKIFEVWSVVEDSGSYLPMFLIDKVTVFDLLTKSYANINFIITDSNGNIIKNNRIPNE